MVHCVFPDAKLHQVAFGWMRQKWNRYSLSNHFIICSVCVFLELKSLTVFDVHLEQWSVDGLMACSLLKLCSRCH